jgi:hypothetical protein
MMHHQPLPSVIGRIDYVKLRSDQQVRVARIFIECGQPHSTYRDTARTGIVSRRHAT